MFPQTISNLLEYQMFSVLSRLSFVETSTDWLASRISLQVIPPICYYDTETTIRLAARIAAVVHPVTRSFQADRGEFLFLNLTQKEASPMADMLETMFELQKKLNKRVGVDTDAMNDDERAKWMLNYARALGQELAELVDSVPWKWWAQYQTFNKHNAKVEIIDMFHFLMSLALTLGLSAKDVFEAYLKKNKVNFERQEQGYLFKDESDNVGI